MPINKLPTLALESNAITADLIASGAITAADISDGEITAAKLHTTLDLSTKTVTMPQASITAHQAALSITESQVSDLQSYVLPNTSPTFTNTTLTGYLAGPATFTIDPAAVGDNTGTVVIAGNLQVDGTTTTINSTTVEIDDLNLTLASGALNAAAANGAGITIDGANATITYDSTNDEWDFNKEINIPGGKVTGEIQFQGSSYRTDWLSVGHWNYRDNVEARFGNSDDLKIYHNSTNSFITNATGTLYINQNANDADVRIRTDNGSGGITEYIKAEGSTGEVQLFHYGSEKLATKSTGVDITGTLTSDALNVSAASPNIDVTDTGTSHASQDFLTNGNTVRATIGVERSSGGGLFVGSSSYAAVFGTASAGNTEFATNNNVRMTISSSGNVGIGTTSPGSNHSKANNLVVGSGSAGGMAIFNGTAEGWYAFSRANANNTDSYDGGMSYDGDRKLKFHTNAGSTRITIDGSGNVGIGTTSPGDVLEVSRTSTDQTAGLTLTNLQAGGYGSGIVWKSVRSDGGSVLTAAEIVVAGENAWNSDGNTASQMQFWTQKDNTLTKHMTLTKNGYLGIGGTPYFPLHVYKSSDGVIARWRREDATNNPLIEFELSETNNAGYLVKSGSNTGDLGFKIGSDIKLMLKNNGSFGIGTDSPFSKLQVGGHTFSGGNGMYQDGRVGISNHGQLTGLMLASTYNDTTWPEYGLVFVQGPSTSNYNVWSISPEGPALGDSLHFIYGSNATNIHTGSKKVTFDGNGNVGIGTASPQGKLHVNSGPTLLGVSNDWHQSTNSSVGTTLIRGGVLQTSISSDTTALKIFNAAGNTNKAGNNYGNGIGFMHLDAETYGSSYTGQHAWIGLKIVDTPAQERSSLIFATNNDTVAGSHPIERMVIRPDGNVGIGTSSPRNKIDVVGAISSLKGVSNGTSLVNTVGRGMYHILATNNYGAGSNVRHAAYYVCVDYEGDDIVQTYEIFNRNSMTISFYITSGVLYCNNLPAGNNQVAVFGM